MRAISIFTGQSFTALAAGLAAHGFGIDDETGFDIDTRLQIGLRRELGDGAGGKRGQVMRVQNAQQRVGQLRKFVIQPRLHAGRKKRDAIQQPGDMRVVHRVGTEAQPAGDLRMRLGEFAGETADRDEFAVEIRQQLVSQSGLRSLPLQRWRSSRWCRS
jgi:hypothetical protein